MTSRRHWILFIVLIVLLSLGLTACERPLPGDNTGAATSTEAPPLAAGDVGVEGYPYPVDTQPQIAELPPAYPSGYPADGADALTTSELFQPGTEEGYPAAEAGSEADAAVEDGAAPADETVTEDTAAGTGDAAESEQAPEAEAVEGETTTEGEAEDAGNLESATEESAAEESAAADETATEGESGEDAAQETESSPEGDAASESTTAEAGATEDGAATEDDATTEDATEDAAGTDAEAGDTETAAADEAQADLGQREHIVASGETLFGIGMQYSMSWVTIAEANDLANVNALSPGQVLIIPDVSDTETADADESVKKTEESTAVAITESSESEDSAETLLEKEPAVEEATYIVQSGDNLYRIGLQFGVGMMEIARANNITNFDQLAAGQEIIIPQTVDSDEEAVEEISHEVAEGETIFGIAFRYGIAWTKLVDANDLKSPYTLETGRILVIPSGE